jgi:beta-glucosidase
LGHALGQHAPGTNDYRDALAAAHTLLLAHGKTVPVLRAAVPDAQVGITLNLAPGLPATDDPDDMEAVQRFDGFMNRWFLDPVYGHGYPDDVSWWYRFFMPKIEEDDLQIIAAPLDFLGINYYFPVGVRAASLLENPLRFANMTTEEGIVQGYDMTAMGWPIVPQGLADLLARVQRDYAPQAVYITENGAAFDDEVVNGQIQDERRLAYLRDHFAAAHQAIEAGVPLRGYFVWSFMDNFEWAYGYDKRFGIVHVDYETQQRTPKASAQWYQQVIAANAVED